MMCLSRGSRPDRLTEVRPQERVLRRTVEQAGDVAPGLPALDVSVPQMVDPAAEVVRFFVSLPVVAEQVIEVPIPQRALLGAPQLAEQLVEVPTTPGYVLAVVAVQTLGWREARALLEQLSTAGPGRDTNIGRRDAVSVTMQLRSSRSSSSTWRCLSFSSSTVWLVFQMLHRDTAHSANCAEDGDSPGAVLG